MATETKPTNTKKATQKGSNSRNNRNTQNKKTQSQVTENKNTLDLSSLPEFLQKKVQYLVANPDARIVNLNEKGRGTISSSLIGKISQIDSTREVLSGVLNLKYEVEDFEKFLKDYSEFATGLNEIVDSLDQLQTKGIELAAGIKEPRFIPIREVRNAVEKFKNPKAEEDKEETKVAAKATK